MIVTQIFSRHNTTRLLQLEASFLLILLAIGNIRIHTFLIHVQQMRRMFLIRTQKLVQESFLRHNKGRDHAAAPFQ